MTASPNRAGPTLRSTSRQAAFATDRFTAWAAVERLTAGLWHTRAAVADRTALLVQAVGVDSADDPDAWLTWTFAPEAGDRTRVTVTLDEIDDGSSEPDLDPLLRSLAAAVTRRSAHTPAAASPLTGEDAS